MRIVLGVSVVSALLLMQCTPVSGCNASTCPEGCCDASGACRQQSANTCGAPGEACLACLSGQVCKAGACSAGATGGGSAATGGGTAATGGGTATNGGGTAATGGGAGATGGGTAANGGGGTSTGGGTASSGGGSSANGGGTAATGGGSASTGGGTTSSGGGSGWGAQGGGTVATGGGTPSAIFYVSTTGSDSTGTGSMSAPWRTLYKATSTVSSSGALIHVMPGTYTETQQARLAVGVSLEGEGANTTILKSTLTADWTEMLQLSSPVGTSGDQSISKLKFDGQNLSTFWGIYVSGRSNVSIHDIVVVDFKDRGVLIGGRNDNQNGAPSTYATGIMFYNNTISNSAAYNTANGVYGRGSLNIGGTEGARIFNNVITQNERPEGYNGWPIKALNDGHNRGLKIYNNTLTKIPFTGANPGDNGWDFAVEMFFDEGTEFYNNEVNGAGFDSNMQLKGSYPYSVWIHDNHFSLPQQVNGGGNVAITLEYSTDTAIVENNVIERMSNCMIFTPRPASAITNLIVRKNLCSHIGKAGGNGSNGGYINFTTGQNNATIDGVVIANNTFLADPNNRPWWGIELGGTTMGTVRNISIVNNIMSGVIAGAIVQGDPNGVVMDQVSIINNDIYDVTQTTNPVWTGVTPTHLTVANNIHTDPLFDSATNYRLSASSPCRDTGTDAGMPFNGAAPDIGYAEY